MLSESLAERFVSAVERIAAVMEAQAASVPKKASRKSGELQTIEDRLLTAWNEFAPGLGLARCQVLTSRDRSNLTARLADLKRRAEIGTDEKAFAQIVEIMATLKNQAFALGAGGKWKIDLHDFLTAAKFGRVEAGKYANEKRNGVDDDGSVRDDELF